MTVIKVSKILASLLLVSMVASCQPTTTDTGDVQSLENTTSDKATTDKAITDQSEQAPHKDAFKYKGAYVGDNSAVGNILTRLPVSSYSKDFELSTTAEPYGVTVNYDGSEPHSERAKIIVYTSTYLISLLSNADWVTFNFPEQTVKLSKTQLQDWYGKELSQLNNEAELNAVIEEQLKDKNKVNELLPALD